MRLVQTLKCADGRPQRFTLGGRDMEDKKYDGWTNYETWLVNLWINNEPAWYEDCQSLARRHHGKAWQLGDEIKACLLASLEDLGQWPKTGLVADLLAAAWGEADWTEIAEFWLVDHEETV
jgi:hypothetical protein